VSYRTGTAEGTGAVRTNGTADAGRRSVSSEPRAVDSRPYRVQAGRVEVSVVQPSQERQPSRTGRLPRRVTDRVEDAAAWGVELPVPAAELSAVIDRHRPLLTTVTTPVLLHFDLWDGNVLATVRDGVARLDGLVDGERYLFGDPMIDFASPWMLRDIFAEPDHPFVRGYQSVRPFPVDDDTLRRYAFAQLYLYLVMVVEVPSRGMDAEQERWRREVCGGLVRELVTQLS